MAAFPLLAVGANRKYLITLQCFVQEKIAVLLKPDQT